MAFKITCLLHHSPFHINFSLKATQFATEHFASRTSQALDVAALLISSNQHNQCWGMLGLVVVQYPEAALYPPRIYVLHRYKETKTVYVDTLAKSPGLTFIESIPQDTQNTEYSPKLHSTQQSKNKETDLQESVRKPKDVILIHKEKGNTA